MPFKIIKKEGYYRIYKINENELAKPKFKTKQSAINQAKNWLRYRGEGMKNEPRDKELYEKVKKKIYKKYKKPSAYRSGALVKEYKKQYFYKYGNMNSYIGTSKDGLKRWFKEKWVDQYGKPYYSSPFSVFRPSKRVNIGTPKTWSELDKKEIEDAVYEKLTKGRVKKF
jgi:hypothetical protein